MSARTITKALLNGGVAIANENAKGCWSVDVWSLDHEIEYAKTGVVGEPVYHAYYAFRQDALDDLDCWVGAV